MYTYTIVVAHAIRYTKQKKMNYKKLFRLDKILPLATIIGAVTAIILSLIGILNLNLESNIIIALIGLIAIDSLSERLSILSRIEDYMKRNPNDICTLQSRSTIQKPTEIGKNASDIYILSLHGNSVITPYLNFYNEKLEKGTNMNVILVSPNGTIENFVKMIEKSEKLRIKENIESSLQNLSGFVSNSANHIGKCSVRLTDTYYPYSIFGADMDKPNGFITVEFHSYKLPPYDRPHITLSPKSDPYWFNYYKNEFMNIWNNLEDWKNEL